MTIWPRSNEIPWRRCRAGCYFAGTMSDLGRLSYASVKPTESRLIVELTPERVKVCLAGPPRRSSLWWEAVMPTVSIFITALITAAVVALTVRESRLEVRPLRMEMWYAAVFAASSFLLYVCFDAKQNGGVVTEIVLEGDWLSWSKVNLWGSRTYRWHVGTITSVSFLALGILKVHRRWGLRLTAFSHHKRSDLEWAASALNEALGSRR